MEVMERSVDAKECSELLMKFGGRVLVAGHC